MGKRRAMFQFRAVLAATLGANYGIYGPAFELMRSHLPAARGQRGVSGQREVSATALGPGTSRISIAPLIELSGWQ
ncbi:MAG: hypothetical protein PW735_10425 [Acidobacteriaceae bacterium]|nr:hypothetical protein [Acidobacteriaceae bacterium]